MNSKRTNDQGRVQASLASAGLSRSAVDVMVQNLDDTVLLGCVGLDADSLESADATLVSCVLDMSGSMQPHAAAVIDAYNAMLAALAGAKAAGSILLSTWAFENTPVLLSSYEPVAQKPKLTNAVYAPGGGTALHDAALHAMTGLVAYGQELWDQGIPTRRVLFLLSDGDDNASKAKARDVKTLADSLLAREETTLAYAGFGTTDPAAQAAAIGFRDVVATGATDRELRKIFRQVSQSVLRVSQGVQPSAGFF